jgi:tripartite-type tricarboxylate transporter receptor subunit TctC
MSVDLTRRKFIATGTAAATLPFLGVDASAQAWPSRPIKIVAGYPAGGQTDLFARTYGDFIAKQLGQPVLVENKAGAGGTVAAVDVKRAPADGYTLMFTISTTMIMNRALMKNLAYDAEKDFQLISIMPAGSLPFVVSPKTGAKTLAEFVEYARRNANKVSIGTYAAGSYAHMVVAELNKQYGLRMEAVHYRGEAPMWTDIANQTIDAASGSYGGAVAVIQGGRGIPVAVSRRRMSTLPNVPTFQEQGATSAAFRLTGFQCCVAPKATPPEVIRRLSQILVEAGKGQKVQDMMRLYGIGAEDSAMTLEDSQKLYNEEAPIWLDLVKSLNLEPV